VRLTFELHEGVHCGNDELESKYINRGHVRTLESAAVAAFFASSERGSGAAAAAGSEELAIVSYSVARPPAVARPAKVSNTEGTGE
jgi:hypothetical protein